MNETAHTPRPARRFAGRRKWVAITLFNSVLLLVLLCAAEFVVRLMAPGQIRARIGEDSGIVRDDGIGLMNRTPAGVRLVPNMSVRILNHMFSGLDVDIDINSDGFRDDELKSPKPADEFRILFLGDSIVWAAYLPRERTFVEVMERELGAAIDGTRFQVVNAGISGIGLEEEMGILRERGLAIAPDLIVVGFYMNDSRPPFGFASEPERPGWLRRNSLLFERVYKRLNMERLARDAGIPSVEKWRLELESRDWRRDREDFLELAAAAEFDWGAAWDAASWESIEPLFAELARISERESIPVKIVCFPVALQVYTTFVEDGPQRRLAEVCKRHGFGYLDPLPALRTFYRANIEQDWHVYFDHCHPSAPTNELIGRLLARDFLEDPVSKSAARSGAAAPGQAPSGAP